MKKLTVLLLSLVLLIAFGAQAYAFDDLTESTWSEEAVAAVDKLAELGIVQGDADGLFWPEDAITRAEFAKVASLALLAKTGAEAPVVSAPDIADVSSKAWYALDVATAVELGLMQGDADGYFRPGDTVTGNEVVTVLLRALGYTDADLTGTWPGNYLAKARELGLVTEADRLYAAEMNRIRVAELVAAMLELPQKAAEEPVKDVGNQEKPAATNEDKEVAKRDYGVLTAKPDYDINVLGFETGAGTYRTNDATQWQTPKNELAAGQIVYFTLNKQGQVLAVSKQGVFTSNQHEADIKNGQISFGGNSYKIGDNTHVLLMNSGGGVSRVAVDKLLKSNYVADLRSASYSAPLQYVLEGNRLAGLLIGDYKGQSDLHFGYIESYGESADGMQVQFYGDETNYDWKYIGNAVADPQENMLYAYRFRAGKVEAYLVGVDDDFPEIKEEIVKSPNNICLTEDGKQFIVNEDTVVMRVSMTSGGRVYAVSYDEELSSGDKVDVRYKKDGSMDIEAVYVIIFD